MSELSLFRILALSLQTVLLLPFIMLCDFLLKVGHDVLGSMYWGDEALHVSFGVDLAVFNVCWSSQYPRLQFPCLSHHPPHLRHPHPHPHSLCLSLRMLLESVSLAVSVITQCYFTGALLMMVRSWREELVYNILIKCQSLGYEDLQKRFLAFLFSFLFPPYLRWEGREVGMWLSFLTALFPSQIQLW